MLVYSCPGFVCLFVLLCAFCTQFFDLRGRKVVQLQFIVVIFLLHEMLGITFDILHSLYVAIAFKGT